MLIRKFRSAKISSLPLLKMRNARKSKSNGISNLKKLLLSLLAISTMLEISLWEHKVVEHQTPSTLRKTLVKWIARFRQKCSLSHLLRLGVFSMVIGMLKWPTNSKAPWLNA
jgi:hypothetical protein